MSAPMPFHEKMRLLSLLQGLQLEAMGGRVSHGIDCRRIVREEYGIDSEDGNMDDIIREFEFMLRRMGVISV